MRSCAPVALATQVAGGVHGDGVGERRRGAFASSGPSLFLLNSDLIGAEC